MGTKLETHRHRHKHRHRHRETCMMNKRETVERTSPTTFAAVKIKRTPVSIRMLKVCKKVHAVSERVRSMSGE